jgi:hypothetical protein
VGKAMMIDKAKRIRKILLFISIITVMIVLGIYTIVSRADTPSDIFLFFILLAIFVAMFFTITSITEFICRKKGDSYIETKLKDGKLARVKVESDGDKTWVTTETGTGLFRKVPFWRFYTYVIIMFVLIAIFVNVYYLRLYAEGEIINGIVLESHYPGIGTTGEGSYDYKITYEYNVDGQNYVATKWCASSYNIGDKIAIRILSNSPNASAPIRGSNASITFCILIILVLMLGIAILYRIIIKKNRRSV